MAVSLLWLELASAFTVPLLLNVEYRCVVRWRSPSIDCHDMPLVAAVYVITGLHAVSLPEGTWAAFIGLLRYRWVALAAPLGGRVARKISQVWLARVFALLLVFVSIHLILSA